MILRLVAGAVISMALASSIHAQCTCDQACPPDNLGPSLCVPPGVPGQATTLCYNSCLNPNADRLVATRAILGQPWTATVNRDRTSVPASFLLRIKERRPNGCNGAPSPNADGRILVVGNHYMTLNGTHDGTTGTLTVTVPCEMGLAGVRWAAQATVLGGGIKLSSGVLGVVGTF